MGVGIHPGLAIIVVLVQVDTVLVLGEDECFGGRVYDTVKNFVGGFDVRQGLKGHLTNTLDASANDSEGAGFVQSRSLHYDDEVMLNHSWLLFKGFIYLKYLCTSINEVSLILQEDFTVCWKNAIFGRNEYTDDLSVEYSIRL